MPKDCVFIGVGSSPSFEYTSEAVLCYASIFRLEKMSGNDITVASLLSFFGVDWNRVKITKTGDFCSVKEEDVLEITDRYERAKNIYLECLNLSKDDATIALLESKNIKTDPFRIAALADVITIKDRNSNLKVPERLFKLVFLNKAFDKSVLHKELMVMNDDCRDLELSSFFANRTIKNLLFLLDLSTFDDLIQTDFDFIYPFFVNNFSYLINIFKSFDGNPFEDFERATDDLIMKISSKDAKKLEIFKKRNQIGYKEKYTLEEVGSEYSVTRERIRQIEAKTKELIIKNGKTINGIISMLLLSCLKKGSYVNKSYLLERFTNPIYADYLAAFVNCFLNCDFEYDEELECFLRKGDATNIEEELIAEYPMVITMDEFIHFDSAKKKMVPKLYNLKKNNIYVRKGTAFSDFVLSAFDELFPEGGRISEENCSKLCAYLLEKYDVEFELAPHTLESYLVRNNYCFVDRGTFLNRKFAASIEEEILQKIVSYILSCDGIVYYSQILAVFKNDFTERGIENWYYVKGVIDPLLPSTIRTKRDYCCKTTYDGNVTTHFVDIFKKHNGILTLKEFLDENPGVKDYILFNYANNNYDRILWLSDKTFVDVDYIDIPKRAALLIKEEINSLFKVLNTNVITDSKLYVRVKHSYPELISDMPYIRNSFDLYSLTRYLLSNEYFFSRPFISKDSENLSYARVISNYLLTLDRFDLHIVQSYCSRMHLRIYNYLDLLIYMSNEFVQITKDGCVNRKAFAISNSDLEEIKTCLSYYINSFGEMDLRKFNGYSAFPKIKYQWSQYLLVGIVTTFFDDLFEVEYTDNQYTLTSYIIRRK